ncbi:MAG: limonene-1,2-epoxide hydrolase family protein [Phenylobacterium sp.]|uniref:nuclear transport factor 2 family protein n=1 Tax=Phenylobacterium sp. TaxID=1871053 RepID=UPI0027322E1F|nr:limonene-1,2-epoxide hydrolase family protein [Phenylobacterium sp.]MDP1643532.1 limonene-1,2-epoxide hydrolase family protein [Phenylobacterium sp.]MDP3115872.1 limonene-1,2-epoxide hydrolase family protein [Phenylobacterium sp.]MDP3385190.1 limonene-1,2-epoxide hydrolase family protein [Phenylobacterium sp.]MDZ4054213.1 limonene-1,2-epoxide hydrolase family protein [Phenylobacterium sp.]
MAQVNAEIIANFIAAWSRRDPAELASYFCEDGCYHNMPTGPVHGREAIAGFIGAFVKDWTSTDWEVLTLMAEGDRVVAERLDRTMVGGKPVDLPCCGVFEMEKGQIKVWRDYFDLSTYLNALK